MIYISLSLIHILASFVAKFAGVSAIEYKKIKELVIGVKYPIEELQNIDSKYGNAVLATIRDYRDDKLKYSVYLPKRYASVFVDDELKHLAPNSLYLVYCGEKTGLT